VVEQLPSKCEALRSTPSTAKLEKLKLQKCLGDLICNNNKEKYASLLISLSLDHLVSSAYGLTWDKVPGYLEAAVAVYTSLGAVGNVDCASPQA
jgi:hypothetical protein